MAKKNKVFIATSLDGYIADKNGGIDWLHAIPNPDNIDMGYGAFMSDIDALVMGRTTFDTVRGFGIDWPYPKPVFVLSNSMTTVPDGFEDKIELVRGSLVDVLGTIRSKGHRNLYIDGGRTIQNFLKEDLIDEMILTTIPCLLGGGVPLFEDLSAPLDFECVASTRYLDKIVQNHFVRTR